MKLNRVILILAFISASFVTEAQTNATIEKMQKERAEMQKQVEETEKLITSTDKSLSTQVSNLNIVTARLKERRRLLSQTKADILSLDNQSSKLTHELNSLQEDLDNCRDRYADACRFYQHQHNSLNPLTFLFSSEDFRQLSRRSRYITEYSGSLSILGDEIREKQDTLNKKKEEIELVRSAKVSLQAEQQEQTLAAEREEAKQSQMVKQLQSKRSTLKKEMAEQQKQINKLNDEIDRQIQLAIKEEQERRKRAAGTGAQSQKELQKQNEADLKLSGSFENNKGKLPMPITGSYLVVGEYGVHNVAGMKDVKTTNLGIDIQGQSGAKARVIYDGTVSTIFQQSKGQIGVLVRHGKYISVYCNLSKTNVKKGDVLTTGDIVGSIQEVGGKTILHFQLHRENTKLNPSDWLRR